MTKKIYRTANGKMVDLGALQLQNENVRAVGNMGVNARGDLIDGKNKSIKSRNEQVAKQYKRQVSGNVKDEPVATSKKNMQPVETQAQETVKTVKAPTPVVPEPEPVVQSDASQGGLAAAIARARSIKQEPMTPAPSRNSGGPVKI